MPLDGGSRFEAIAQKRLQVSTEQLQGLFIESLVEAGVFAGGGKGLQRIGVD